MLNSTQWLSECDRQMDGQNWSDTIATAHIATRGKNLRLKPRLWVCDTLMSTFKSNGHDRDRGIETRTFSCDRYQTRSWSVEAQKPRDVRYHLKILLSYFNMTADYYSRWNCRRPNCCTSASATVTVTVNAVNEHGRSASAGLTWSRWVDNTCGGTKSRKGKVRGSISLFWGNQTPLTTVRWTYRILLSQRTMHRAVNNLQQIYRLLLKHFTMS